MKELFVVLLQVFGAYCSSRWQERNLKDDRGNRTAYFGTGETFLFSLYPERAKYPWVGMEGESVNHSAELFMAADSKMITIGGGYALSKVLFVSRKYEWFFLNASAFLSLLKQLRMILFYFILKQVTYLHLVRELKYCLK